MLQGGELEHLEEDGDFSVLHDAAAQREGRQAGAARSHTLAQRAAQRRPAGCEKATTRCDQGSSECWFSKLDIREYEKRQKVRGEAVRSTSKLWTRGRHLQSRPLLNGGAWTPLLLLPFFVKADGRTTLSSMHLFLYQGSPKAPKHDLSKDGILLWQCFGIEG